MNLTGIRMFSFCRAVRMSDFAAFRAFTIRMTVFFAKTQLALHLRCEMRQWTRFEVMAPKGWLGHDWIRIWWFAESRSELLTGRRKRSTSTSLTKLFVNLALKSHSFDPPLSSLKRTTVDSSLVLMVSVCWPAVVRIQTNQIPQLTALYRELANGTTSVPVTRPGLSTRYTHHTIWEKINYWVKSMKWYDMRLTATR